MHKEDKIVVDSCKKCGAEGTAPKAWLGINPPPVTYGCSCPQEYKEQLQPRSEPLL